MQVKSTAVRHLNKKFYIYILSSCCKLIMNKNKAATKKEAEQIVNNYFPNRKIKAITTEKVNFASGLERLVEEELCVNFENVGTDVLSCNEGFNVHTQQLNEISLLEKAERNINADCIGSGERSIRDQLARCFVQHNVPARTSNEILRILKPVIPSLPTDARTLKGTPRVAPLISINGGKYVHYGIMDSLTDFVRRYNVQSDYLELNFNVDGLPISKSSGAQVWPILMNVSTSDDVFAIGIYEGYTKPKNSNEYVSYIKC